MESAFPGHYMSGTTQRGPGGLEGHPGAPGLSARDPRALSFGQVNASTLLGSPPVEDGLRRLEPALVESVTSGDVFLDEVTTHLIRAGGKRIRPALTIAAATGCVREATDDDVSGAVSVELVHQASLYHDDVIDEAVMRRRVESVNSRWGNLVAIVAGDFLLARSAEIAASLGQEVAALLANTLARLCDGQLIEIRSKFSAERTETDYFDTITGKTAALMATACRVGALTSGRNREEVDALTRYGLAFGVVFQIRDDLLDVIGTEKELGKPTGQDLEEGIYTLPVLLALTDPTSGPQLRELLGRPLDKSGLEDARSLVVSSGAIDATIDVGRRFVEDAERAAAEAPTPELGRALGDLARSVMDELVVPAP
jgi:heptaprenyl diphosphate synthase